ncbi:MAG: T9SS type A sorting domain-containing protein [Bacteroidia bacterium]|nr:T9SS type A sorting domain-containing protein [Bacteroidia bacterium]
MKAAVLIVLMFLPFQLCSQSLEYAWSNQGGGQNDSELLWRVAVDDSGNVFSVGCFRGTFSHQGVTVTSSGQVDVILLKYNSDGMLQWAKTGGGVGNDIGYGVDTDSEGNIYITGAFSGLAVFDTELLSVPDPSGVGLPFHFIAKYNRDGVLIWIKTVNAVFGPSDYPNSIGYDLKIDANGSLVVTGQYNCNVADTTNPQFSIMSIDGFPFKTCNLNGFPYVFVQKLDTAGNTSWLHTIGGGNGMGTLQSIAFDGSNNIVAVGSTSGGSDFISGPVNLPNTASNGSSGLMYRLDTNGNPLNGFLLDVSNLSNFEDLAIDVNDNLYMVGYFRGVLNGIYTASGNDGVAIKTDINGNELWVKTFTGPGDDFIAGITETTDPTKFAFAGYYFYQATFDSTSLNTGPGNKSALVIMDTNGDYIERLQPVTNGGGYTLVADIRADDFGNYYLCGDMEGNTVFTNDTIISLSQDMYVCKVSPVVVNGVSENNTLQNNFIVYPNPFHDIISVQFLASGNNRIELLSMEGKLLQEFTVSGQAAVLDFSRLKSGMYLLKGMGANFTMLEKIVKF